MITRSTLKQVETRTDGQPLRVGFVPVSDCAPVVFALESGLFEKYELHVELKREPGWAGIRDKVMEGELDAAHAPATLPFISNLGINSDRCACVSGLVLSLQGNGITLSRQLWDDGVREAAALRDMIYRHWRRRTYTLGVVFPFSPSYFLLRRWLKAGGIEPNTELRIVTLPPAQLFPTLKLGYIDGFCAGEPWSSLAAQAGAGVCVATSAELAPRHPEKVLMVRRDFAEERAPEHERLIAALLESCAFCDQPENRPLLSEILSQPQYVNAPADCFKPFAREAPGSEKPEWRDPPGLEIFHRQKANDPTEDKAAWLVAQLHEILEHSPLRASLPTRGPLLSNIFRRDIFERAQAAVFDQTIALKQEAEAYEARMSRSGT